MGAFCSMGIDGILSTACKRRGIAYQPPQMHASHALGGRVWHVEGCILGPWSLALWPHDGYVNKSTADAPQKGRCRHELGGCLENKSRLFPRL